MVYYINLDKKRLVGRCNQLASIKPDLSDFTRVDLSFQLIDNQNKIQTLTQLPGAYIAGASKLGKSSSSLLFWSDDFEIADNTITFHVDLRAKTISDQITKPDTEFFLEIGTCPAEDRQTVLLKDRGLISPRTWHAGEGPEQPEVSPYYTKSQVQQLLAEKEDVIDEDNKLDYSLISGAPVLPEHVASEEYVDAAIEEATSGLATQQALNAHVEDEVIHVSAQEKIIWDNKLDPSALDGYATTGYVQSATSALATKTELVDGLALKEDAIGPDHKVPYELVSGHPAIPSAVSQLQNDSGYQTAAQVDASIASATSGKQDLIDADNKLSYDLLSSTPSIPASTSQLQNDSGYQTAAQVDASIASATSGKLDAPSGGSEGQVLTKTAEGSEWADPQAGAAVQPYNLPVSSPSAGEKWFSAASEDWTREFPAEQKAVFLTYTSGAFLNFPRVKSTANTGNIRTVEVWVNMTSGSLSGFTIPAKYQASDIPEAISGAGGGDYWYGGGGGTRHVFVMRFLDDGSENCPVRLNYADEWKTGGTPELSSYLTFEALDAGDYTFNTMLHQRSGVYSVNGGDWTSLTAANTTVSLQAGDRIRFAAQGGDTPMQLHPMTGRVAMVCGQEESLVNTIPSGTVPSNKSVVFGMTSLNGKTSGLVSVAGDGPGPMYNGYAFKFRNCDQLTGIADGYKMDQLINLGRVQAPSAFAGCSSLVRVPSDLFGQGDVFAPMGFYACYNLEQAPAMKFVSGQAASGAFQFCRKLETAPDFTQASSLSSMFTWCEKLSGFAEVESWELKATAAQALFGCCSSLVRLPDGFTAPYVVNANAMFADCSALQSLPAGFSLSAAVYGYGDIPAYNYPTTTSYARGLFQNCRALQSLPAGFSLPAMTTCQYMFQSCRALQSLPDGFSCESAINLSYAFFGCNSLTTIGANVKIGSASITEDNCQLPKTQITSIGENFVYLPGVTWSGTYDPAVGLRTWFPNLTAEGTPSVWACYQYTNQSQG